jgi:predicted nucleic acid-binding protein
MQFVLDASVTLAWAFADESNPVASRGAKLLQTASTIALVPEVWWYEVRNTLLLAERRGRIPEAATRGFLQQIARLQIQIDIGRNDIPLLDLARQHNLSVYDAAYLALAIREKIPLATLDTALGAAAAARGVPSLA